MPLTVYIMTWTVLHAVDCISLLCSVWLHLTVPLTLNLLKCQIWWHQRHLLDTSNHCQILPSLTLLLYLSKRRRTLYPPPNSPRLRQPVWFVIQLMPNCVTTDLAPWKQPASSTIRTIHFGKEPTWTLRLQEKIYLVPLCHQTGPNVRETQRQMSKRNRAPLHFMTFPCLPQRPSFADLSQPPRPHRSRSWSLHPQCPQRECPLCRSSARWFPSLRTTPSWRQSSPARRPVSRQLSAHLSYSWALRCPRAPSCLLCPSRSFRTQSLRWWAQMAPDSLPLPQPPGFPLPQRKSLLRLTHRGLEVTSVATQDAARPTLKVLIWRPTWERIQVPAICYLGLRNLGDVFLTVITNVNQGC